MTESRSDAARAAEFAAPAEEWDIDPVHSGIYFKVRHMMISHIQGHFEKFSGAIRADEENLEDSTVEVTIDAASINTRFPKRDEDLRGPDFLDVARYPRIAFLSKRVEKAGRGRLRVTGDLTIRDVTREVVLDVNGPSRPIKDMQGKTRVGASTFLRINRKDFGLTYNNVLEGGGAVVGNGLDILIDVELVRKEG